MGRGSNPHAPARGLGALGAFPAGFGAELRPPKGFPLFLALRVASPSTIILLTVDYHAAIGGKTPVSALRTPLLSLRKAVVDVFA